MDRGEGSHWLTALALEATKIKEARRTHPLRATAEHPGPWEVGGEGRARKGKEVLNCRIWRLRI